MIDTDKYENMRQLFLDFIDTASDEVDEEAWKDKLTALDELLAEVKRLREENQRLGQYHHCLYWLYDKERFDWEVDEEQWEFIGRLLGAVTDHNDNYWEGEEE